MPPETPSPRKDGLPVIVHKKPTVRTSAGLRDVLFEEIDAFRRGHGDSLRATAISNLASRILASAKLEHDIARQRAAGAKKPEPVVLGTLTDETAKG